MTKMISIFDLEISNKRVLIRQDLNVPLKEGSIVSEARIKACLPTIEYAIERKAKVAFFCPWGYPGLTSIYRLHEVQIEIIAPEKLFFVLG